MIDLVKNYSLIARRAKKSIIRELLAQTNQPDIISFAGGLPDPLTFPDDDMKKISKDVIDKYGKKALQYGETNGVPELKEEIVKISKKQGENITVDNIIVTAASQQGLDLVGRAFIDNDDPIFVELPSYIGGLQAFHAYGAKMYGIPIEEDGLNVDMFEQKIEEVRKSGDHYKFLYVVPDFQNPSGVTLSEIKRRKLISLSEKYNFLIIEDTPYRELRFDGQAPPTLFSLDSTNNVICLHTFSKTMAPGLRLGWIVANSAIIDKLSVLKQSIDLCTQNYSQYILYEYCKRGLLEKHIEEIKTVYKKKKDTMLSALEKYLPKREDIYWTKPDGGLFLWVSLPESINTDIMFKEALQQKVAYIIGSAFFCNGQGTNTMRLNFSFSTLEQIDEGIKRLANVIKKKL